ncbi:MAG: DMT family transporter, partial [Anaerolineales bacterium]
MSTKTPDLRAIVALVLAAACWGVATAMSKSALAQIPPLTLLVTQLTVSLVFLWVVVALQRPCFAWDKMLLVSGMLGWLNPGISYTLSLLGLTMTTASMSTLLWAAEPILIVGLARFVLGERLTRRQIFLSAMALIGVTLVAGLTTEGGSNSTLAGNALTLAGVACCALYTVFTRRIANEISPTVLVTVQQSFALLWAMIIWPFERWSLGVTGLEGISISAWAWAGLSGLIYYALAYWLYLIGLQRLPASLAAMSFNLIPIFGVGAALMLLGETLAPVQWVGAL